MAEQEDGDETMTLTQDEIDYLLWFFQNADFGPADTDVRYGLERYYEETKSLRVPDSLSLREEFAP